MKVFCCVLASENTEIYRGFLEQWRRIASSCQSYPITIRFLLADPELSSSALEKGDCLYVKTQEHVNLCKRKLQLAFQWFLETQHSEGYTHFFRPNLSSFIHIPRYLSWLSSLPSQNLCTAFVGGVAPYTFPSGAAFTLSVDILPLLLQPYAEWYTKHTMDDVVLGRALMTLSIPIRAAPRLSHATPTHDLPAGHFHVRIKTKDRLADVKVFSDYVDKFYQLP